MDLFGAIKKAGKALGSRLTHIGSGVLEGTKAVGFGIADCTKVVGGTEIKNGKNLREGLVQSFDALGSGDVVGATTANMDWVLDYWKVPKLWEKLR